MNRFEHATNVGPADESGRFAVDLDEAWTSLRGLHGGYVVALLARAAEAVAPGRELRTITASFLRPSSPGPASIEATPVRAGCALSTAALDLRAGDRLIATARATLATPTTEGHDWQSDLPRRPLPVEQCVVPDTPPGIRHFEHARALLDPTHEPFSNGTEARVAGHVRPLEPQAIDAAWLAMILDWFPPSPFTRFDTFIGGVSIDYTVHVHATLLAPDPEEWLEATFESPSSQGGMAVEHGRISTRDGQLLAESFHTRWTR